ncbi:hypothetical protein OE749_01810 [Aestuariibacter sp. AA17]|uniref:DUF3592 domain-containing protein n=1 Tax=Fluctibacter corallii TaxID=2984329 RepID=A0ABT3A583_9ALTE|nr:hypothetical protein [Aestuariibacter sp. AA17]MCV2883432.1 hypothetical protein [Aestuariibacter sp. AA17]
MSEKQSTLTQLLPFAKIGSVLAFIGGMLVTFNHFAGYSYLKGRFEGMGLGLREIEISQQEITFQTTLFLRDLHQKTLEDTESLFTMGLWPTLVFIILGGIWLAIIFPKAKKERPEAAPKLDVAESNPSNKAKQWFKKIIAYPAMFALGFYGLVLFLVTFLMYLAWGFSMSYEYGLQRGKMDIGNEVCISLELSDEKKGRFAGCSILVTNTNKQLVGKVIHKNKELTVMVTNTESLILDNKGSFVACSPIVDLSKMEDEAIQHNCFDI